MGGTVLSLSGFSALEPLGRQQGFSLFRAFRKVDQRLVLLKTLPRERGLEEAGRLQLEYELLKDFDHVGIMKPLGFYELGGHFVLAVEDIGGFDLKSLAREKKLNTRRLLDIFIKAAMTLAVVHRADIIHQDLRPEHFWYNAGAGRVALTGFGFAGFFSSRDVFNQQGRLSPDRLTYLSPEQSGRINRYVDWRTDFYSFGVSMYELLTGAPPFCSLDPFEVIHAHLAKEPTPPHVLNPSIPEVLSRLVLKLLEKSSENRYKSAAGLAEDLKECLLRLDQAGRIAAFALGGKDIPERFQASQKVYGRERELTELKESFLRVRGGAKEMFLVKGEPGVGKTSLVGEFNRLVSEARGRFISGKFEQNQADYSRGALPAALQALTRQLLSESEAQLAFYRQKLLEALGVLGRVIIELVPDLELIIGPQPPAAIIGPAEANNRFKYVFQNFLKVFSLKERPLVIFLDDLQWADRQSLHLLELIMTDPDLEYVLVAGAFRDAEVEGDHPLTLFLESLAKKGAAVRSLQLEGLGEEFLEELIFDAMPCSRGDSRALAALVQERTRGNPFFVIQFLQSLASNKLAFLNQERLAWEWDLGRIRRQAGVTQNVVDLMVERIRELGPEARTCLVSASALGRGFTLDRITLITGLSRETAALRLNEALEIGLAVPIGEARPAGSLENGSLEPGIRFFSEYQFCHDRVRQAAYSLIPPEDRSRLHLEIGLKLLAQAGGDELRESQNEIVGQLNLGREGISDRAGKIKLSRLNLLAGRRAKAAAAYELAGDYFQAGLGLLDEECWDAHYALTLALHEEEAETAYLGARYEEMDDIIARALNRVENVLDKVKLYEIRIQSLALQNRLAESTATTLEILGLLGVHFPRRPGRMGVLASAAATKWALSRKTFDELLAAPPMTDPYNLAAMRILLRGAATAYMSAPALFPLMMLKMVRLSVKFGPSPFTSFAFTAYGLILCGALGDMERGYGFGKLGLRFLESYPNDVLKTQVTYVFNAAIRHWKEHTRESLPDFREAFKTGLETGEIEYACLAAAGYANQAFRSCLELSELALELKEDHKILRHFESQTQGYLFEIPWQACLNLLEAAPEPHKLVGEAYNEEILLPHHLGANHRSAIAYLMITKLMLCCLFRKFERVDKIADMALEYLDGIRSLGHLSMFHFYDSLSILAGRPDRRALQRVSANQKKLKKWSGHAPMNNLHRYFLVEAEKYRAADQEDKAVFFYEEAVAAARKEGFWSDEGLACELAGDFCLNHGRERQARIFIADAFKAFSKWGAKTKLADLKARYSGQRLFDDLWRELRLSGAAPGVGRNGLDVSSVVKASQLISGEIQLGNFSENLMRIIMENTGAQRGFLILDPEGHPFVEAEISVNPEMVKVKSRRPLDGSLDLSAAVTAYATRTRKTLLLDDASQSAEFSRDPYIREFKPKSLLCAPLIRKNTLLGLLYLENNLVTGAFEPDRLDILDILCSQAAISLENARLYEQREEYARTLEQRVEQRTRELMIAKDEAEKANRFKSDFLAAISHEIRTPLNAILGIVELMAERKMDGPRKDKYLATLKGAGDSLLRLINDLLEISRIEAGQFEMTPEPLDPVELTKDVCQLLLPMAREKGLVLECVCGPSLPGRVLGDPVRLRQVLVNLIFNSLKFTEQGSVTVRLEALDSNVAFARLLFRISDTGIGIPKESQNLIFERFTQADANVFRRYGGSGLGLALVRQLVGYMGGFICLESNPGKGACISFSSVFKPAPAPAQELEQTGREEHDRRVKTLPPLRLLVVDDVEANREIVGYYLEGAPHRLEEAKDGREAFGKFTKGEFDLVLMDMWMPGLDGFECVKSIRAWERETGAARTPIVAMTASALARDAQRSLEVGCDGFLIKPVSRTALLQSLHAHGLRSGWVPADEEAKADETGGAARIDPGDELEKAPEGLKPLLSKLVVTIRDLSLESEAAFRAGDWEAVRIASHKLAGAAGFSHLEKTKLASQAVHEAAWLEDAGECSARLAELLFEAGRLYDEAERRGLLEREKDPGVEA
ncbi:MAG: AAA family ATPase [Pseudomonadota bacterium]